MDGEVCGANPSAERRDVRAGVMVSSTFASSAWIAAFMPASVRRSGVGGALDSFLEGMEDALPMRVKVEPGLILYADTCRGGDAISNTKRGTTWMRVAYTVHYCLSGWRRHAPV